jgi:hypothetical protein
MPIVHDIDGEWFHSRSSSSRHELENIFRLVIESRKPKYINLNWTESVILAVQLAGTINIADSTMRTKIRAWIRFGFLKDKLECPLEWSEVGLIWEALSGYKEVKIKAPRDDIEQLIIASAIALYSFDEHGYQIDPSKGFNPSSKLISELDSESKISETRFEDLVGLRNKTYWSKDFFRSGLFTQTGSYIYYSGKFPYLFEACKQVSWPTNLATKDWKEIHGNSLDSRNPLAGAIKEELANILENLRVDVVPAVPKVEKSVDKMEGVLQKQDEKDIEIGDYSIPDAYSKTRVRFKQNAWSNMIRKMYSHKCCVPECDSEGGFLVESSHIKPYRLQDDKNLPHRANPSNGLCFCPNCHKLFDKGYFSFTDDLKILVSSKVNDLKTQHSLNVILKSIDEKIDPMPNKYLPEKEFLKYHRDKILRK